MPGDSSRRNGKKGGRPAGSRNVATLEKDKVSAALRQRILHNADRLFNAQMALAEGCSFLLRKPKVGKNAKTEIVTDPETLRRFVDGELEGDEAADYFWLHTERPNIVAIQDAFNRAIGKPTDSVEVTGKDGDAIKVVFGGRHKPQEGQ